MEIYNDTDEQFIDGVPKQGIDQKIDEKCKSAIKRKNANFYYY